MIEGTSKAWIAATTLLATLCVGCTVEMTDIATAIPAQTPKPTGLVMPSFAPSATKTATAAPVTKKVLELAKQYGELRKVKGYFTGGEWNDDVDSSRGRLYTILDEESVSDWGHASPMNASDSDVEVCKTGRFDMIERI